MYKTHNTTTGAVVLHMNVPTIEEVFDLIEKDELDLEADEVISYYYTTGDLRVGRACVATYQQIMKLYSIRELILEDVFQD